MRRIIAGTLALTLLSSTWLLGSEPQGKKKTAKKPAGPNVSQQLQQMKDQLNGQQQQINQLQQQLQQSNQQLQQAQQQLQSGVSAASQQAQTAAQQAAAAQDTASSLNSQVADLKTTTATTTQLVQTTQKEVRALQAPASIAYKGLKLTPGGFAEGTMFERQRNQNGDIFTQFSTLPLNGNINSGIREFRGSARLSRLQLLAEGKAGNTKITSFFAGDFMGVSPVSNYQETNSWVFRVREAWGQVATPSGFTFTGGQMWSLNTLFRKGIDNRTQYLPMDEEFGIVVGFNYLRQMGFRMTKTFGTKAVFGFEVDNAETTVATGGTLPGTVQGLYTSNSAAAPFGYIIPQFNATDTQGATVSNISSGATANYTPDIIAKFAFDPGWGHYEVYGIGRVFRDRLQTGGTGPATQAAGATCLAAAGLATGCAPGVGDNSVSLGGGVGAGTILPITKKTDFILTGAAGAGIGRYAASDGTDVTINNKLQLTPVKTVDAFAGIEIHPTPKIDYFAYGGGEYYQRVQYSILAGQFPTTIVPAAQVETALVTGGVGSPLGYGNISSPPGTANKDMWMVTTGVVYRLMRGPYGTIQVSPQIQFLQRETWAGLGGSGTAATAVGVPQVIHPANLVAGGVNYPTGTAKGQNAVAWFVFRYILP